MYPTEEQVRAEQEAWFMSPDFWITVKRQYLANPHPDVCIGSISSFCIWYREDLRIKIKELSIKFVEQSSIVGLGINPDPNGLFTTTYVKIGNSFHEINIAFIDWCIENHKKNN